MVETMKKNFLDAYAEVFDECGNIKACGREKCIELIEICYEIDPYNYYGDINSGFLNKDHIFELKKQGID